MTGGKLSWASGSTTGFPAWRHRVAQAFRRTCLCVGDPAPRTSLNPGEGLLGRWILASPPAARTISPPVLIRTLDRFEPALPGQVTPRDKHGIHHESYTSRTP